MIIDPLVPQSVDLRDFAFMPLDVVRLRDSDLSARASGEEFRCAVLLWCASWHQEPAASLPDDDVILANLAGFGRSIKDWLKQKKGAMRGWIKCSDGRLYHPVVAEKALEAWEGKLMQRWRTECARIRKHNERHKTEVPQPYFEDWKSAGCLMGQPLSVACDTKPLSQGQDEERHKDKDGTSHESSCETASKGQGQGQGQLDSDPNGSGVPPSSLDEDPKTVLFREGLAWLARETGKSEATMRTALGKMLQAAGGDTHASLVLGILRDAKRERKADPVAWVMGMLKDRKSAAYTAAPEPYRLQKTYNLGFGIDAPAEAVRKLIETWQRDGKWLNPGPKPGEPGCRIPDEFLPPQYQQKRLAEAG